MRHGRGFRYLDETGAPLPAEDVQRIREMAIPPAWTDVWICPYPRGHLLAVGTDAAQRRQYLYHPHWRVKRDLEKFDRVAVFGSRLPDVRARLRRDLRAEPGDEAIERQRVLAVGIRLLDLGCFRPGSETSVESGSHGLTTLERQHVRSQDGALWFRFQGKAGIDHEIRIDDDDVVRIVRGVLARRPKSARVLASKAGRRWSPVSPDELNAHLRELTGLEVSAKDFRTWHATAIAAATLASGPVPTSVRARQRRVSEAVTAASDLLGNTPAIARASYIDPRVIDLFNEGVVLDRVPRSQDSLDRAVAALLDVTDD
ncbi:MAG: DNA topoisomerase IB [Marmoricola sp.]